MQGPRNDRVSPIRRNSKYVSSRTCGGTGAAAIQHNCVCMAAGAPAMMLNYLSPSARGRKPGAPDQGAHGLAITRSRRCTPQARVCARPCRSRPASQCPPCHRPGGLPRPPLLHQIFANGRNTGAGWRQSWATPRTRRRCGASERCVPCHTRQLPPPETFWNSPSAHGRRAGLLGPMASHPSLCAQTRSAQCRIRSERSRTRTRVRSRGRRRPRQQSRPRPARHLPPLWPSPAPPPAQAPLEQPPRSPEPVPAALTGAVKHHRCPPSETAGLRRIAKQPLRLFQCEA
mmetsp:Transcript_18423/g.55550  ORF Transcript_18423/g.55550 Transcript_18423/m.55550 type:complete len:287 (-) Transcript_18423:3929-4789(-)